jgi:hypothetical protein
LKPPSFHGGVSNGATKVPLGRAGAMPIQKPFAKVWSWDIRDQKKDLHGEAT